METIKKRELSKLTFDQQKDLFIECYPMQAYNIMPTRTINYFKDKIPGISKDEIEILIFYYNGYNF